MATASPSAPVIEPPQPRDLDSAQLPAYGTALIKALRFSEPDFSLLRHLDPSEWKNLLGLTDKSQVTLLLSFLAGDFLPEDIRHRIARNSLDNTYRFERLKTSLIEIATELNRASINFCLLKGLTHSPDFTPDPLLRAQGDIDLWCSEDEVLEAREVLRELGYRPLAKSKGRHLDPMVRETAWRWTGDYFARDLPMPVDLHFELWDRKMESIAGPNEAELWRRRSLLNVGGVSIPKLDTADTLTFAVLHFMMHLLHGDLRLQRSWEIGYFVHNRCEDSEFWLRWQTLYSPDVLRLQLISFALAHQWFGCALPNLVARQVEDLPDDVKLWLEKYGFSPISGLFTPNKDELWLNLLLVPSFRHKSRIFLRRLLPLQGISIPSTGTSGQSGLPDTGLQLIAARALHHARTLPVTCYRAIEWWWFKQRLSVDFVRYLFASALFDFGEFIFFLLYNLYLLELGFDEKFIGRLTASATAGTFVGIIPAAAFTRRFGLRTAVLIAILGTAAATAFRALVIWQPGMLAGAFMNGLFMSFWAVSLPPAIADLTGPRNRTFGFSLITSIGIGSGVLAGFIGSRIPEVLLYLHLCVTSLAAKRSALVVGSSLAALALVPALLLQFGPVLKAERLKKQYPRGAFVWGFMGALFIWTMGTGGFNPFFSVYLAKHLHLGLGTIGIVFSTAQMAQVVAIPLAALVVRQMGQVLGIATLQFATGLCLLALAVVSSPWAAALLYVTYMSVQYMSEPCLLSMLMTRVERSEQSGASALNFLTTALAGMLAASVSGAILPVFGYKPTLIVCAAFIAMAAGMFYVFLRDRDEDSNG